MTQTKPNIVYIMTDDQGIWSLGCYGNNEIHTPNPDRLAAKGTKFDQFYCTSPVCSPSRASLLTGRIPSQHGVNDWISGGNIENPIEYLAGQVAYTDVLAENGYICGLSGKWHLGDSLKPQKSFSHWYVHQSGGGSYYDAPMIKNGECINQEGYLTKAITDDALEFLAQHKGQEDPFYLSIHYTAPHHPWINSHPEEFVSLYDECAFETCPQNELKPWFTKTMSINEGNWRENAKGYYGSITAMDHHVGRVMDYLDENGLTEDTLVIFTSDNGFSCGHHGFWGKGNGTTPLNMYDYSIKVPLIISHPGTIPEGQTNDSLLSGYDFMPTLLEYVGLTSYTHDKLLPGKSFATSLLNSVTEIEDEPIVVYDEYGPVRMIRTKEWKYIHRYPVGQHELYHLVNDPGERNNLVDQKEYQARVNELKTQLTDWFLTYVDPKIDAINENVTGKGQSCLAGKDK